jgi:hypothetical protein
MKRLFILIALAVVLTSNAYAQTRNEQKNLAKPSQQEILINYEKQTWELVKQKDLKAFTNLIAEDYYGIYPNAENVTKPKLVEFLGAVNLKDYQLSNFKVTMLNKDAAIITYQADVRLIDEGKEASFRVTLTSGWARRNGKWLGVFYRETLLN